MRRRMIRTNDMMEAIMLKKYFECAGNHPDYYDVITGKRIAAYRRVSADPFQSMVSKRLLELEYQKRIEDCNAIQTDVYIDEGTDCVALNRLLEDCSRGDIDLVVSKWACHLSKDMNKVEEIIREMLDMSVDIYFEGEALFGSEVLNILEKQSQ